MLITLPHILNAEELSTAQRLLVNAPWEDGRDSAGPQAGREKQRTSWRTAAQRPRAFGRWCSVV